MNKFESLVTSLQNSCSSEERQSKPRLLLSNIYKVSLGLVEATAKDKCVLTCQQLGVILMALKYPAERMNAASILSAIVVDPENAGHDLRPFLSLETSSMRKDIISIVASCVKN